MHDQPSLLVDLVVALAIAAAGGWIATRLRLSSIVGYIAAGLVISPLTPGFVGDVDRLRLIAEIGVVLLMFSVGVHFSFRDLMATPLLLVIAGVIQVAAVMAGGTAVGVAAGWGLDASLFAGAAIAISSSTVIVKLLTDEGRVETAYGRAAVAWSIVEDLSAVVILAVLIGLTGEGDAAARLAWTSLKALVFVAAVLVVGLRMAPLVLDRIAQIASRELFVLGVAAVALGMALASEEVGLSTLDVAATAWTPS